MKYNVYLLLVLNLTELKKNKSALKMSLEPAACEGITKGRWLVFIIIYMKFFIFIDLKAFERRLTEVIACLQPATRRWRCKYHL